MNRLSMHPATAAPRSRRAFLLLAASGLFTALLAAPAPAVAQGMGVIHFLSGDASYLVNGNGTNLRPLTTSPRLGRSTARADYPGGRQYLHIRQDGQIHGATNGYGNIMAWNEAGQSKAVTEIHGPLYMTSSFTRNQWSNDGQDSFVSFYLHDPGTGLYYVCRAHVTAAEIASDTYQPVTGLDDPRLELVAEWPGLSDDFHWHPSGMGFYYVDTRGFVRGENGHKIRVKTVGVGATMDDDPIIYDGTADRVEVRDLKVSPVNEQLVFHAWVYNGPKGLVSVNLTSGASGWIARESSKGLVSMGSPCFSPDGSLIAFEAQRSAKGKTYYGVYKLAYTGGTAFTVTESPNDGRSKVTRNWTW